MPASVELTDRRLRRAARPPPVGLRGRVQVQPWRLAQALDAGPHHAGEPARLGQAFPDMTDSAQELARIGGPPGRVPAGGREHELVDRRSDVGRQRGGGRDVGVDVLVGDRERGVAGERQPAGEQLEQHHAGRVDVSARAGGPAGHLLRRHVRDRADEQPGPGVPGHRQRPGQAEVGHLDPAVGGHQDVLRLDVAVHDAGGVRGREAAEHAGHDLHRRRGGEPPAVPEQLLERAPGHVLHRQVQERAVGALVVDGDHVLLRQPRHRLGLADEPADEFLVPGQLGVHDLERHLAVQPRIGGPVDRGHPAVRDARGHRVPPIEQSPGEGIGQGIVHRDDFTVVLPVRRVNHRVPGGQGRPEVVAGAATPARSAHHMGQAAAAEPYRDLSGPGVISPS